MPVFKLTWLCQWEGFPANFQLFGKDKMWKKTQPYKTDTLVLLQRNVGRASVLSSQTSYLEMSLRRSGATGSPTLAPVAWWAVSSNTLQVSTPNSALTITSMPSLFPFSGLEPACLGTQEG